MAGINKVILVGNVGGDIDCKTTEYGLLVNLNLATSYITKNQNGNNNEITEWHRCRLTGKLAEIAQKYITKGQKLYIEGMLKTEKWVDKTGENRYTTRIVVKQMQILSNNNKSNFGALDKNDAAPSVGIVSVQPAPPSFELPPVINSVDSVPEMTNFDDDIPF